MKRRSRQLGFVFSLLLHGAALALFFWWQQQPSESAIDGQSVPVQLSMFAEQPPALVQASAVPPEPVTEPEPETQPAPEPPAEPDPQPTVEPEPDPEPEPEPDPLPEPAPEPKPAVEPDPQPRLRPAPKPVDQRPTESPPVDQPPLKPQSEPEPQLAQPPASAPTLPQAPAGPAASAPRAAEQADLRARYKAQLLAAIERHKHYPARARRRGIEGQVQVGFSVMADGSLQDIHVVKGSGSKVLDKAALEALRKLGRVQPIPAELGLRRWELVVPMAFGLL